MAAQIEVNGYVDGIKEFSWGTVVRVSSTNSIKNKETGQWETASRDYYDVTLAEGVTLGPITENDKVIVRGSFKIGKQFAKKDGSVGLELKVRARSIELDPGKGGAPAATPFEAPAGWEPMAAEDAPF